MTAAPEPAGHAKPGAPAPARRFPPASPSGADAGPVRRRIGRKSQPAAAGPGPGPPGTVGGDRCQQRLLSQIERAEADPTVDILVRIAEVLDTSCTDLLRRPLLRPDIVRASSLEEAEDETSVNLLFSGHEHSRMEVYRSRLHPHAQSQWVR